MEDRDRIVWALGERVKELTALHSTSRILQNHLKPQDRVLEEVAALIPPAWQYPEVTAARVAFRDMKAETPRFILTPWLQSETFFTQDNGKGSIEVVYLEDRPPSYEGPFLKEERALIQSLAQMLSSYFDRKAAEEQIRAANNNLEEQVRDRTAQLRRLTSELALAEERQRRAIASDLHDHIGQALAVIKSRMWDMQGYSVFGGQEKSFEEVLTLLDQAIRYTRTLTFEISPPVLYELGLEQALRWLCGQTQKKHGLKAEMSSQGTPVLLPDDVQITLFRSVQELMMNAVKHARAAAVQVRLEWSAGQVRVDVRDDGLGFDAPRQESSLEDKGGFGLFSIRERMKAMGGSLRIVSAPGQGAAVTLLMPLKADPAAGRNSP